jgi:hypothetical protein
MNQEHTFNARVILQFSKDGCALLAERLGTPSRAWTHAFCTADEPADAFARLEILSPEQADEVRASAKLGNSRLEFRASRVTEATIELLLKPEQSW